MSIRFLYPTFALVLAVAGCNLLEVDNPNSLTETDLDDPAAANPMANGLEASVTRALISINTPYAAATDELKWVGSRNAWQQLDFGNLDDPLNEFTDAAFPFVAEARWLSASYIQRLETFRAEGRLPSALPLIRCYLYGATIYITIADVFDDFVLSDRQSPAPPLGEVEMVHLYDVAVEHLDAALALGPAPDVAGSLTALRARARYSRALWHKLHHQVDTARPLVADDGAVTDARAALALLGPDMRFELAAPVAAPIVLDLSMGFQVNSRRELRFGDVYVTPTPDGKGSAGVRLMDPIDGVAQPFLEATIADFSVHAVHAPFTVVSAREMHLIIAEAALASGDMAGFTESINVLREKDGLTPYSGQIAAIELLEHARQVYLFLQGRRLTDLYRFGRTAPMWRPDGTAVRSPGTFFPIANIEIQANPHIQ